MQRVPARPMGIMHPRSVFFRLLDKAGLLPEIDEACQVGVNEIMEILHDGYPDDLNWLESVRDRLPSSVRNVVVARICASGEDKGALFANWNWNETQERFAEALVGGG